MKKLNLILMLIMLGFGMAVVQTAHAEITSSPLVAGGTGGTGP